MWAWPGLAYIGPEARALTTLTGAVRKQDIRVLKATCCSKPHTQGWFLWVRRVRGVTVLEKPGMNL